MPSCHTHPDRPAVVWRKRLIPMTDYRGEQYQAVRYFACCEECRGEPLPEPKPRAAWETAQNGEYDSPHYNDYEHNRVFPVARATITRGGKPE